MTKLITPEIVDNIPSKTSNNTPKLSQRDIAYSLLRQNGLNNTDACKGLKITDARGTQIASKLKKKFDLTEETFLRPAHKAIKNILKGKSFGEVDKIKDSTVLAAASMVYDRVQPVVKHNVNVNANVNFVEVNLSEFK